MENLIYQQGDCILKKVGSFDLFEKEYNSIPIDSEKLNSNLLLKGTTNSHALYGGEFNIYKKDNVLFVDILKETTLDHVKDHRVLTPEHAEHHAQQIAVGQYFVAPLMEYDHLKEESRRVID